jgi:eukaryotic-like serine/threonine-protein kinase
VFEPLSSQLTFGTLFHERYELVRCIKVGGMGVVYEVVDHATGRRRAMKTMLPSVVSDPDLRARFALEATVTAPLESEHIVEVLDAGVDERTGLPFLVMELLKGEDLGSRIRRNHHLPPEEAVPLLRQVAVALDQTRALDIVHRDLKPENLFVAARDDGSLHLKVLDFGIAKVVSRGAGATATCNIGTPLYMSPEQIRGDATISYRADLYALGHIAYTALTGLAYWEPEARRVDSAVGLQWLIMKGLPQSPTERAAERGVTLPDGFDAWFARATALDPAGRWPSAAEMVAELAGILGATAMRSSATDPRSAAEAGLPYLAPQTETAVPCEPTQSASGLACAPTQARHDVGGSTAPFVSSSPDPSRKRRRGVRMAVVLLVSLGALLWLVHSTRQGGGEGRPAASAVHPDSAARQRPDPARDAPRAAAASAAIDAPRVVIADGPSVVAEIGATLDDASATQARSPPTLVAPGVHLPSRPTRRMPAEAVRRARGPASEDGRDPLDVR